MADTVKPLTANRASDMADFIEAMPYKAPPIVMRYWSENVLALKAIATWQHMVVEAVELNELREKAWKYEGLCS